MRRIANFFAVDIINAVLQHLCITIFLHNPSVMQNQFTAFSVLFKRGGADIMQNVLAHSVGAKLEVQGELNRALVLVFSKLLHELNKAAARLHCL